MGITRENVKIAVALRTARAAIGWSQQELADKMGVAKSTVARIETVETIPKADFLTRAMRLFHEVGVLIDLIYADTLTVAINPEALDEAIHRLEDELMRRSDRRGGAGHVKEQSTVMKPATFPGKKSKVVRTGKTTKA